MLKHSLLWMQFDDPFDLSFGYDGVNNGFEGPPYEFPTASRWPKDFSKLKMDNRYP